PGLVVVTLGSARTAADADATLVPMLVGHDLVVDEDTVVIGEAGGDHVIVGVVGRMHPGSQDYWDGNWLITPIRLQVGGFTGTVAAGLRAEELRRFRV